MRQAHASEARQGATRRSSRAEATIAVVTRFNDALNRHDVDAAMALMTEDCLFENTSPAPDGERYQGQEAVRAFWSELFRSTPDAHFEAEELFAAGDRCAVRWRYTFNGTGQVRGADVIRVRDGKIAEKLAYAKGLEAGTSILPARALVCAVTIWITAWRHQRQIRWRRSPERWWRRRGADDARDRATAP
jgi:ketosteroid isomerase-like protein